MKFAKWIVLIGYAVLWMACAEKPGKKGILSINKMKLVMWDVMMVDEFAQTFLSKDSALNIPKESEKRYQQVFGLYKISSQDFYKSFEFYRTHPSYFKILLDSISAYGNRLRDSGFERPKRTPPPIRQAHDAK